MRNCIALFLTVWLLSGINSVFALDGRNCATMEVLEKELAADPTLQSRMDAIESFTNAYIKNQQNGSTQKTNATVTIPVVFHVVYNTAAQNVSDAMIQAQLDVLNKDYSATNTDIGSVPSAFSSLVANSGIQFCLAQRDPNGNPTTGIVRVQTTKTSFTSNNAVKYTAQGGNNAWDRNKYLNIWVCNLGGGLLGYAQFPGGAAATDGVVVLFSSLPGGTATNYNGGRTATHEVGHWLNLRHIWGDAFCGNDLVSDTPKQQTSNSGCPNYPHVTCSNGPKGDMFMNYMDYTYDRCMYMFTAGQSTRMNALFASGGARASLLTSNGCVPVSGGSTCITPTGISKSNITSSSVTIGWSASSGAVSYVLQYRPSTSGTWIQVPSNSTSVSLSNLSASTKYYFQVQTVCSGSSSSFSVTDSVSTISANQCTDAYESNNTVGTAKTITVNTDIQGLISTSTDIDHFKFSNTSTAKNIQVILSNLPANYNVQILNSLGLVLKSATKTGTTNDTIKYNGAPVGTYIVKVFGASGAYNASACYKLRVNISSTTFLTGEVQPTAQQKKCAAMDVLEAQLAADPEMKSRMDRIEEFTNTYIQQQATQRQSSTGSTNAVAATVTIPVVFHVLYNTTAQNVSDAMIQAQLDVLNKDYSATNSDKVNVPSAFASLVSNTNIQFCLAQRDPSGNATTGIVRKQTSVTSFSSNDAMKYTAQGGDNAWDATKYLNIWVCNLGGGLLGYAQFPGGAAATDGVVILYSSLPGGSAAPYNKGRTATHEVGHWLNLRHIWGDANCGSDLVSDTPTQQTSNYGCPSFPHVTCSNGANGDMFMNYMDYTDDACMYMFSAGQSTRMNALFATSGARVGLTTSLGCVAPSTTCGTPSGLAAASITTSGATISWTAVSGATSYNIQYKTSSATTWTSTTSTTNSKALSGLTAGTTYNFQVQAVCSAGSSAYSSAASFTTASSTSCGTPSGLASSSITSSSATVSWTAVSGATSYNVQYKTSAATTWTTTTSTTNSKSLSGLAASTTYNVKVQAVCSGGSSVYSTTASFTTAAATTTCSDIYESNNSLTAAKTITVNTDIKALIGASTDKDFFKFSNSSTSKNIKVTLTNLPKDYDLKLYNSAGSLLGTSQNSSTTSEGLVYNNAPVGTYYIQVYGYSSAYSTSSCYTLRASTSSTTFREIAPEEIDNSKAGIKGSVVSVFPNPTTGQFTVRYITETDALVTITIFDITGKSVLSEQFDVTAGENLRNLSLEDTPNGLYMIDINDGQNRSIQKLMLNK